MVGWTCFCRFRKTISTTNIITLALYDAEPERPNRTILLAEPSWISFSSTHFSSVTSIRCVWIWMPHWERSANFYLLRLWLLCYRSKSQFIFLVQCKPGKSRKMVSISIGKHELSSNLNRISNQLCIFRELKWFSGYNEENNRIQLQCGCSVRINLRKTHQTIY